MTIVYGALSTHRHTDPDKLTIPLFARSVIYEAKVIRGFWLYRWFATTPVVAALAMSVELVVGGAVRIPEGRPVYEIGGGQGGLVRGLGSSGGVVVVGGAHASIAPAAWGLG